jgi:hypothetical protein
MGARLFEIPLLIHDEDLGETHCILLQKPIPGNPPCIYTIHYETLQGKPIEHRIALTHDMTHLEISVRGRFVITK